MREMRNDYKIKLKKLEKDYLEDLDVDVNLIYELIVKKGCVRDGSTHLAQNMTGKLSPVPVSAQS
jgi:hypothetical protein